MADIECRNATFRAGRTPLARRGRALIRDYEHLVESSIAWIYLAPDPAPGYS